jgi:hypothetical protein
MTAPKLSLSPEQLKAIGTGVTQLLQTGKTGEVVTCTLKVDVPKVIYDTVKVISDATGIPVEEALARAATDSLVQMLRASGLPGAQPIPTQAQDVLGKFAEIEKITAQLQTVGERLKDLSGLLPVVPDGKSKKDS